MGTEGSPVANRTVIPTISRRTPYNYRVAAKYTIRTDLNLVLLRLTGTLTDFDLLGVKDQLRDDPKFNTEMDEIVDGTGITDHKVTAKAIKQLASAQIFNHTSKRALVGSSDIAFGMARMFEFYSKKLRGSILTFRNVGEALARIGHDKDALAPKPENPPGK